jgi:3-ketosteroid 9alpha-monooxygenase subunit B
MPDYISLAVVKVIAETHDSCSFELAVPPELDERFQYRPGQFLTVRIPCGNDWLPRCYSLSSSPYAGENLRVTVKRVEGGRGSNWLCDQVKPGDQLQVLVPAGAFVPKRLDGDFLLLAGGSGITPVLSILRSVLSQAQGRVRLVYANRDEKSVIFQAFLLELVREHPGRLQVVHWLGSVQGHPDVAQLAHLAAGFEQAQAFICGPAPFMDASCEALKCAGLPSSRIHVERFVSLPSENDQSTLTVVEHADATATQLTVELDGATYELNCAQGEVLLAAMRREGLPAPHSCLVGSCATCMCTLVEGAVALLHNDALDQQELSEGWTLACQAVATSDKVHLRFPE